ncbi:nitrilase-related carbon-nitrogen hydrolase [Saccharopolyspora mangrovi]|uniref:Nitrilase-related carbon-nitrogen hydrolase n=1 Tax=Saccharopolyspora mangrovi TaxID=3082379 RepID=A0ABU6AG31_9PSEU|nr:nitrilase-related carbon-nitrogen hydrolase [Saccharopolyspora sp. S2-29]MEB3370523.1 nitrilase-related carbon-nitrogen hydrolase [Saccharopolyspora sp. S2-29]
MAELTVATAQLELRAETSLDTYVEHVDALVERAAAEGAELVVFPEMSSTGLLGSITDHTVTTQSIVSDYWDVLPRYIDDIVDSTIASAHNHGITVLGGSHNRRADDGTLRNTAYLVHPDGRVEQQDKMHLTPQEHSLGTRGGDQLLITQIGPFTAGLLICADIQFPELSRYLVRNGVDLILCPSLTWNRRGVHRVRTGCQARAIENQLYVVMSPLVGHSGLPADAPMHAVGRALVSTPVDRTMGINDGILALGAETGEDLVITALDHDLLMASRDEPEAPGLKLQRPDLYAGLMP